MVYVISNINGCYDKWQLMLKEIKFSNSDDMYVLGDVIDYSDESIPLLFDMMERHNVYPIMGEREYKFLSFVKSFPTKNGLDEFAASLSPDNIPKFTAWIKDGGRMTFEEYMKLSPADKNAVLEYLDEFMLYDTCFVGDNEFVFTHCGIKNFDPKKALDEYEIEDFIDTDILPDTEYYTDKYMVLGHKPTFMISAEYAGKIYKKGKLISCNGYKKPEDVRNVATWCARFGIELLLYPSTDTKKQQVIIPCEEDLLENPAIYGLYIVDEPYLEEQHLLYRAASIAAKEKYGKYGWQIYINAAFQTWYPTAPIDFDENDVWTEHASVQWRQYYADVADILSFDMAPYQSKFQHRERYTCLIMEQASKMAKYLGQKFFVFIDAYDLAHRGYCDKMFRTHSYLLLSFGVQGIEYFQYGDASKNYHREGDWTNGSLVNWDYSKNEYWYDAQKINAELKKLTPVYARYKHIGAYAINKLEDDNNMYLHAPCDSFGIIEAVDDSLYKKELGRSSTYLVGCFEAKEAGNGKAFTLVNMDALDDVKYGEQEVPPIKLKINRENVTCYKNGEAISMKADQDGYYSFSMPNGECVFVTVQ